MWDKLTELDAAIRSVLATVRDKLTSLYTTAQEHQTNVSNPHHTDKWDVGLGKVQNYPPSTQKQAQEGKNNNSVMTPLRVEQHLAAKVYTPLTQLFEDAINQLDE